MGEALAFDADAATAAADEIQAIGGAVGATSCAPTLEPGALTGEATAAITHFDAAVRRGIRGPRR